MAESAVAWYCCYEAQRLRGRHKGGEREEEGRKRGRKEEKRNIRGGKDKKCKIEREKSEGGRKGGRKKGRKADTEFYLGSGQQKAM